MRGRLGLVGAATVAVVIGTGLPASAVTPSVPSGLAFERSVSNTPVLAATVSDADGGTVTAQFFARRAGATAWDLLNAAPVSVTSGQVARAAMPVLPAGTAVEWTVKACDASTCSAAATYQTSTVSPMVGAGPRKNATALPFQLGDRVRGRVDVGTGNLMVTATGPSVLGVSGDLPVDLVYNSLSIGAGVPQSATANVTGVGWTVGIAARLQASADGSVIFWGPSGLSGTFTPNGAGGFAAPAGVTADLVAVAGGGWTLTDHQSAQVITFNAAGMPTKIADRNGNQHTVTYGDPYNPTRPTKISAPAGLPTTTDVTFVYATNRLTELRQGPTGSVRAVKFGYDGNGDLVTVTDAANRVTTFTYTGHQLTKALAPGGIDTRLGFDARNRTTAVRQVNTTAGSAGDTVTRLAYPSETQVLVSDGAQEQTGSPTSGPHSTYTLDAGHPGQVLSVVDAANRTRSATWTANVGPATTTEGTGASAGTTTFAYGANNNESLTSIQAPTGAARGWAYTNTAAATKYLPSSSTDDAGNQTLYTYNGAGNPLTSTNALAATATLTRDTDGTVTSATAPGNGTNKTVYTYTAKQLTKITPVTGSSLGVRDLTYDTYGRLKTETNGRGVTTTYTYDVLDRVTGVDYSGTAANPDVTFTYDAAGRQETRTDPAGTTTFTYDQVSNLRSRVNTFDNKTVAYTYDKAARLAATNDARGSTTYAYDSAGALISMGYDQNGGRATTRFAVDGKGRRTDTWMQTNATNTAWAAHAHTDFDASGRPSHIIGERNLANSSGGAPTLVVDLTYCYAAGSTYPACSSAPSADRSFLQWRANTVTGQVTTYTYDTGGRLTGAATTAGTDPVSGTALPAVTYTYAYDIRGNRATATTAITGGTTTTQTRTFNAANQTTTTGFTYDGAGNLTADPAVGTIAYSAADQMTSVTRNGATYDYVYAGAGNNELLRHEVGTSSYTYTYGREGANGRPVIEQVNRGDGTQVAYLNNDPTGQPIQLYTSTGQNALYIYDGLGSPVALLSSFDTTAFQYSFDPYGVEKLDEGNPDGNPVRQTPFLYTGGLDDRTTGWTKNGARYYSPTEGRWTQHDTLDQPLNPANANRYAYAANNPVNYIDPSGESVAGCVVSWVGFGASYVGLFASLISTPVTGPIGAAAATSIATGVIGTGAGLGGIATSC
jgi:RHS repeat-associated protein